MESTNESEHHTFLARARPFEPPIVSDCSQLDRSCESIAVSRLAPQSGTTDRRRRPFPRSVGTHHGVGTQCNVSTERHTETGRNIRSRAGAGNSRAAAVPDDARRGAEQALRLLLEVLDRRRPADRLGKMFSPNVIESVKTIVKTHTPGRRLGPASLRRVHLSRTSHNAAEVFGTYARGSRIFAVAARLEYKSGARCTGWTITSLRVG